MKTKSLITQIIVLIFIIAIVSFIAIFIKDNLSKTKLEKLDTTIDIAASLENKVDVENVELLPEEEKILVQNGAIAVIDIPSVRIRGQVVEGTSDYVLKNYIGKFRGCAGPGENGNFCVAAHNNICTEIFRDLHKVKVNEKVRVITKEKEYIYLVKSLRKILPTQIEVLKENKNLKEITLITCSDMARSRIVVKGDLIEVKELK